jgi:hypothetical protein
VNRTSIRTFALVAALVIGAGAAIASADESTDMSFKLKGPIDAVSCTSTPPTVTVFGLVVDTTNAVFDVSGESEGDDDQQAPAPSGDCTSLVVGNVVELTLTGDADPLAASKVEAGDSEGRAGLLGPVQAIDAGTHTITLFGLVVDASQATTEGCDDGGQPAAPVDLTQLSVGQFVDVKLDETQLPALVATRIEVRNFTNQVAVDVDDEQGQQVGDDSVDVSVDQTVVVAVTSKAKNGAVHTRHVRRAIHLQLRTGGHFVLSGLAKGPATIKATRIVGGRTTAGRHVVVVHGNKTTKAVLRLHVTRTR